MNQAEFAGALGMTPAAVSRWEAAEREPTREAYMQIFFIAEDRAHQEELLARAGIGVHQLGQITRFLRDMAGELEGQKGASSRGTRTTASSAPGAASTVDIPLLRDSIAAGAPRAVNEKDIDHNVSVLREWLPAAHKSGRGLIAARVAGDSMAPIIAPGHILIIDTSTKDPKKLLNRMVAVWEDSGVTVKWLRKDGPDYILAPQHTSLANPIRILRERDEEKWGIVGEVVKWIGEPPPPRGRR